jgi:putative Mn2+ efflux pump MntP
MNALSIVLLGLAMATDAFAAALGKGAGMAAPRWGEALRIGLIFGVVEAITPLLGWLLGAAASSFVAAWDHWIAFGLLVALGLHMIHAGLSTEPAEPSDGDTAVVAAAGPSGVRQAGVLALALTGLATSIDALAVGIGLAFVEVNILLVAGVIGLCTFAMVTVGVMAGRMLGTLIGKRAEIAGGLVLIAVGAGILHQHLTA